MKLTKQQNRLLTKYVLRKVMDCFTPDRIDRIRRVLIRQFKKINKQTGRSALSVLRKR